MIRGGLELAGREVVGLRVAERAGADTRFQPSRPDVGRAVYQELRPGDVVLTLGAGNISQAGEEILKRLEERKEVVGEVR